MNTYAQSEIFFIISSVGFVTLWILLIVLLIYLIKIMHTFTRLINKVEKNINEIGDSTKDMIEDIKESTIFKFIFGKKRKGRADTKS